MYPKIVIATTFHNTGSTGNKIEPLSNSKATGYKPRSVYYYTGSISDYGGEKLRVARLLLQSKELWKVVIEGPEESSIKAYSTLGYIGYPPSRYSDPRIGFRGISSGLLEQDNTLGLGENTKETPKKKSSKGKNSKVLEVVDPLRSTKKNAKACTIILSICS
ncbi:uncharacterized protein RAG0_05899 [Rhynchosporium agropyri]|uniref:Uncharacterized protein n=1 Tax=Rhynchosporium agropyri TaxID=914238 RepID=A0A1E1KFA9_9HELO|nr:uncharacterized protein RAG0_05899 [Rhynchosporium agropyri]